MAVKLRLQRKGRKKAPFYQIVAADARAPRDGKYIERIGTYNPLTVPATINLNHDRAFYWVMQGAQPTNTVRAIFRFRGVNYRKHLQIGVNKGAITQEEADRRYQEWMTSKDENIQSLRLANRDAIAAHHKAIDGVAKIQPKQEIVVEEAAPVVEATETVVEAAAEVATPVVEAVEATAEAVEEVKVEAAEVVEAATETVTKVVTETVQGVDEELAGLEETTPPPAE